MITTVRIHNLRIALQAQKPKKTGTITYGNVFRRNVTLMHILTLNSNVFIAIKPRHRA